VARSSSRRRNGLSLAKGPIGLLGLAGVVFGVLALIFGGRSFALHVPHGAVGDGHYLGLFTNGWTDLLFLAAGLLLLVAAPVHWAAKSAATLVALVFGAAAVIAVVRGDGVFGIFAANGRTELVWGAAAILLAVLGRMGRVGRDRATTTGAGATTSAGGDRALVSDR
jgi:hypothetical protein